MKHFLTTLIFVVLGACFMSLAPSAQATENPDYTIVQSDDKIEIRDYPEMLLAEVTVMGDRDRAANRGFRKLAAFIFGDNKVQSKIAMTSPVVQTSKSESIAMTAPVVQTPSNDGRWTVNFMMPSQYSKETLPVPIDPDIRIVETKPYRTISIRFAGRSSKKNIGKHQERLTAYIEANGIKILSGPEYAFYDAPFVPPMFRRNEVHYRIAQ